MKKILILAVFSAVVVGSAWGASACPAVQPEVMVPVQFIYTLKINGKQYRLKAKNYPQSKLKRFITLAYLFNDIDNNNKIVPITLFGASSEKFAWLLQAAAPNAEEEDRQLPADLKGSENIDALLKLYKLATFLDPVDKKTSYPMVLALLRYINTFSQAGTADDNPRINFLIEGLQKHNFSQTNVALMVGDFLELLVDDAYVKEPAGMLNAFAVVRDTEYLRNSVTNNQVQKLIDSIKQKAVAASNQPTLIDRVVEYLARFGATPETFLVPGAGPAKPTVGRFPLSIKDLQNAQLMPAIHNNTLHFKKQGLTNVDGLDTIDGVGNVQKLILRYNQLTNVQAGVFAVLSQLKILNLSDNQLSNLPAGVFAGLHKLEGLDLVNNELSDLPAGIFAGLNKLQCLDLGNNQLTITEVQLRKKNPDLQPGCTINLSDQKSAQ